MTQERVDHLIEFRNESRRVYASSPGRKGALIMLTVCGDGTYYVDNGYGVERQFMQPAKAIECFNEMVKPEYELK